MPTTINAREAVREILVEITDTGNLLAGAKVILWTNGPPFVVTPLTEYADLTQPTFTGYAISSAVTWGTPYIGADGDLHVAGPSKQFTATAAVSPAVAVQGYALVGDPAGTPFLIQTVKFDAPVTFTEKFDGVVCDVDYILPA